MKNILDEVERLLDEGTDRAEISAVIENLRQQSASDYLEDYDDYDYEEDEVSEEERLEREKIYSMLRPYQLFSEKLTVSLLRGERQEDLLRNCSLIFYGCSNEGMFVVLGQGHFRSGKRTEIDMCASGDAECFDLVSNNDSEIFISGSVTRTSFGDVPFLFVY